MIFYCRRLIDDNEKNSLVNVTYFIEHSNNTLRELEDWNETHQDTIQSINEKIEQILEMSKGGKKRDEL
jgi:hypothetical protein